MRILVDTNVLLWVVIRSDRLNDATKRTLSDPDNEVYFSAVSIWEIAIKYSLKKASFVTPPDFIARGAALIGLVGLPLDIATAMAIVSLPMHHGDPFDRLLIAQALGGPMRFYTADTALAAYSDLVHIVR